jgi:hypothetical protein
MEYCISHNELLNGQSLYQLLECLIFAKSMKPIHIDIPCTHVLQLFHMNSSGYTCSHQVVEQKDILSF